MDEYTPTNFDILHRRESGKKIYWTAAAQRPGWASGEAPSNSSLRTSGWERHDISELAMVATDSSHISITPSRRVERFPNKPTFAEAVECVGSRLWLPSQGPPAPLLCI